jgi:hypothetical protein
MRNPGPSIQVRQAVAILQALGFRRKDFRVRASNGRGHYGDATVIFMIAPERVLHRVDDMAVQGFKVQELVRDGRVAHIHATWLGTICGGSVTVVDLNKIQASAEGVR